MNELFKCLERVNGGTQLLKRCFVTHLEEQSVCRRCKKTIVRLKYEEYSYFVRVRLLAELTTPTNPNRMERSLGHLLHLSWLQDIQKSCPEQGGKTNTSLIVVDNF